jgi:hypothetical protein
MTVFFVRCCAKTMATYNKFGRRWQRCDSGYGETNGITLHSLEERAARLTTFTTHSVEVGSISHLDHICGIYLRSRYRFDRN